MDKREIVRVANDVHTKARELYERRDAIDREIAEFEAYHAGNIYRAGGQDWKASAYALERRRSKRWAKRIVIDTTWEDRLARFLLTLVLRPCSCHLLLFFTSHPLPK